MKAKPGIYAVVVALSVSALFGCASTNQPGTQELPATATSAELGATFGGCDGAIADKPSALAYIPQVDRWLKVRSIIGDSARTDGAIDLHVTALGGGITEDPVDTTVTIGKSELGGIEWGVASKGVVWMAFFQQAHFPAEAMRYAIVEGPSGQSFVPGICADETVRVFLVGRFGSDVLTRISGSSAPEIQGILNVKSVP
jgi:hypothetical protein